MAIRGIRGATTVKNNSRKEILDSTREMLSALARANRFKTADIASVIFTVTCDLSAEFPAVAARQMGWSETPLLCTNEIPVPGSLPKCIRVLIHLNTAKKQSAIKHIYLKEAKSLRR